ncbi:hypothetical protein D3C71_1993280 [compost metagenome]
MEHHVARDVAVQITLVVTAADGQRLTQRNQVFIGTAQRRQAYGLDFQNVPGLPRLLMGAAGQGFHRIEWVDHRP